MTVSAVFKPKKLLCRGGLTAGTAVLFVSLVLLWSCRSMGETINVGAQIAGALGIIDTETADSISRAVEEITPDQEYYIGRAVGANLLSRYRIWQNPELTKYLNAICATIVINSPRPEIYNGYHLAILDTMEINAFATSGGHIFITRGLIACADSEDTLAAVIAHEIGHIQLQHSIKAIKNSRITSAVMKTTGSLVRNLGNDDITELADIMDESVNEIISTLIEKGYSQDQEFDADTAAMALLASAGYDPGALISILQQLEGNMGNQSGGLIKTHPSPARRIEKARETASKFKVPDTRSYRSSRYSLLALS
jgi:predicted Zn-dependent protease